jgi:hypothetical protein
VLAGALGDSRPADPPTRIDPGVVSGLARIEVDRPCLGVRQRQSGGAIRLTVALGERSDPPQRGCEPEPIGKRDEPVGIPGAGSCDPSGNSFRLTQVQLPAGV